MNMHIIQNPTPRVYKGHANTVGSETLSLTYMWKADGSDPSRSPSEWLSQ